jgi:putative ABC transport system ATP-binding protein
MADEPTAALDTQTGKTVMQVLRQLAHEQGCTICITTHDLRTLEYADQVDELEDGYLTPHAESRISGEASAAFGTAVSERIASST